MKKFNWKALVKIGTALKLKRYDVKPIGFDSDCAIKKSICFAKRDSDFGDYGEFYHTFGVPGIFFHGFLPVAEFKQYESKIESGLTNEEVMYFDEIPVNNEEELNHIYQIVNRVRWDNKANTLVYNT